MDENVTIHTNKTGFDFFNTVFFKRHKKILLDSSIKFSIVFAVILGITCTILWFLPQAHTQAYTFLQYHLPYILIIMYFTNRGARVTMAMFVNCDASMLHYRFYKQPKIIVSLFTQRLKTIVLVNLLPSMVLSCGLSLCLFISNNQAPIIYYGLLFCAINALSIFFSVHYLIIYYLLQPYNQKMQATGFTFNVISSLTYIACYMMMKVSIHIFPFTLSIVCFSIMYIIISLILAYRLAPKTFKLKN